jgi:hypothetical protein
MIEHFLTAVVHVNAGIPADVGSGNDLQHLAGADPQAGRKAGTPLEDVIVHRGAIKSHQAAHRRAADDGIEPIRQGTVFGVDFWLECVDQPVHIDSSSALDYQTDSRLRKSLANLDYKPTIFIVSQRTASIAHADKIIVLDDGKIVGIGKHQELLASCTTYSEIYNSQFKKEGV